MLQRSIETEPGRAQPIGRRTRVALLALGFAGGCVTPAPTSPRAEAPRVAATFVQPIEASSPAEPTDRHRELIPLLGEFDVEVFAFEPPVPEGALLAGAMDLRDHERLRAQGTGRIDWALGGQFVRFDVELESGAEGRASQGFIGYDPEALRYSFAWLSERSPEINVLSGTGSLERGGIQFRTSFAGAPVPEGESLRRSVEGRFRLRRVSGGDFAIEQLVENAEGALWCVARTVYRRR